MQICLKESGDHTQKVWSPDSFKYTCMPGTLPTVYCATTHCDEVKNVTVSDIFTSFRLSSLPSFQRFSPILLFYCLSFKPVRFTLDNFQLSPIKRWTIDVHEQYALLGEEFIYIYFHVLFFCHFPSCCFLEALHSYCSLLKRSVFYPRLVLLLSCSCCRPDEGTRPEKMSHEHMSGLCRLWHEEGVGRQISH